MASSQYPLHLPPIFSHSQQAQIGHVVNTKISNAIASDGLVCSHCSKSSQLLWFPEDKKVPVPTILLQGKQLTIFERHLSEQASKLQQFMKNRSCIRPKANTSNPSATSVVASPSTSANLIDKIVSVEQRLTDLEYRFEQLESSVVQSSNLNPNCENIDPTRLLEGMHTNFVTNMSRLQLALKQTISNQQKLESTDCNKPSSNVELVKRIISLAEQSVCMDVRTEKLQSDVDNLTVLHSVAVDKHEVLSSLVSNIGHEHNELAEVVRELSQCTASANDVVELKAIVDCIARVTGISEHKAEQLIADFIGREGTELEHLKCDLRFADNKIRELLLAKDQMINMHGSAHQNQVSYLNFVTKTMQRECERYKHDLNAMADSLSERLSAKIAQIIKQSLVDKHQQNNETQIGLLSTEGQVTTPRPSVSTSSSGKILTDMLQPDADNGSTVTKTAVATTAVQDETELERHQDTRILVKHTALSSPPHLARMPTKTGPKYTSLQRNKQLSNSNKPLHITAKSVSKSEPHFEKVAEPLSMQQQTTTTTTQQRKRNRLDYAKMQQSNSFQWRVIDCVVVGNEYAQSRMLIHDNVDVTGTTIEFTADGVSINALVADRYGIDYRLHLVNCTEVKQLEQITVCDIIVICFSVIDDVSYQDVRNVWLKQIKKVYPNKPYLLVGTYVDQRQQTNIGNFQIECEQGWQLSQDIGSVAYFECSHQIADGVETIFKCAMQHVIDNMTIWHPGKYKCLLKNLKRLSH